VRGDGRTHRAHTIIFTGVTTYLIKRRGTKINFALNYVQGKVVLKGVVAKKLKVSGNRRSTKSESLLIRNRATYGDGAELKSPKASDKEGHLLVWDRTRP